MSQFVQMDIILNKAGRLDQTPVERDRSTPGAGTPTRSLVAHGDATHGQSVPGGQFQKTRRQFLCRQHAKMMFKHWPQVSLWVHHFQRPATETNSARFSSFDARQFASK